MESCKHFDNELIVKYLAVLINFAFGKQLRSSNASYVLIYCNDMLLKMIALDRDLVPVVTYFRSIIVSCAHFLLAIIPLS